MMKLRNANRKHEQGQSLVELSLVLVVFLLLVMGVVDLGRVFFYYISMYDAAEEGVFFGSIYSPDGTNNAAVCTKIEDRAKTSLTDPTDTTVTVIVSFFNGANRVACRSATKAQASIGSAIEVAITQSSFALVTPILPTFIGRSTVGLTTKIQGNILKQCVGTGC